MRALVVANFDELDAGHVGRVLLERGLELRYRVREAHDQWDRDDDASDASLVVALGSAWSTYWDHVAAPVEAEQRLMTRAIERGIPVLGICFGAQQLATVIGGHVSRAPVAEIGWHMVESEPAHPCGAPEWMVPGPWMQWHYDQFTVPDSASVLARSPGGVQAFRAGTTLGVQFHPEATEHIVSRWSQGDGARELAEAGIDADDLLGTTARLQPDAARRCERLVDWFLSDVAQLHMNN